MSSHGHKHNPQSTTMCKFTIPQVDTNATADNRRKAFFESLISADLTEEVEKKNNLSYVSWANAWKVFKQFYPSATYQIHTNPNTGLPYFESELGIMVHTSVEADGLAYENWLPVMEYSNRSMKSQPYTVNVYDKFKKQTIQKQVEAATTFDVNSAVQRSLVKCMAMHGLGLYLYSKLEFGEEARMDNNPPVPQVPRTVVPAVPASSEQFERLRNAINATTDVSSLVSLYMDNTQLVESNPELKALLSSRKKALQTINF